MGGDLAPHVLLPILISGLHAMNLIRHWLVPAELPAWRYAVRLLVVVVELLLAYSFAGQTNPFFYQAF